MSDPTRAILFNYATEIIQCFNGAFTNVASIEVTEQIETELLGLSGAGSASVPSIFKSDDPNTGLYWIAADSLGITAGGVLRATFSSRGVIATGLSTAIATKTANYPVTVNDHTLLGDCTGGNIEFELPDATTCAGQIFFFKRIVAGGNDVNIDPNGTQTIDGSSDTVTLTAQWDRLEIQSDGANWVIINSQIS